MNCRDTLTCQGDRPINDWEFGVISSRVFLVFRFSTIHLLLPTFCPAPIIPAR